MASVLTQQFGTNNMLSFLNAFTTSPSTNMYMMFSRSEPWGLDVNSKSESEFGFQLPIITSTNAARQFKDNVVIAGIKILTADLSPVIPRINWNSANSSSYLKGTCVITDEWNVYIAKRDIQNPSKPIHTSYVDDTADWGFLYKISDTIVISKFVNDKWIPVNIGSSTGNIGTPNQNAIFLAKSQVLMFSKSITTTIISLNDLGDYREIALWTNVADGSGNLLTTTVVKPHQFNQDFGSILYVNRRLPIYRSESQSEESQLLLGF